MSGHSLGTRGIAAGIRVYQRWISPLMAPRCRFYPSCSTYALEAVAQHGAVRGTWLATRRVCRCHPFNPGGVDLVPERTPHQKPDTN